MKSFDELIQAGTPSVRYATSWMTNTKAGYCPKHTHPTLEIVYHTRGHGTSCVTGGQTIDFKPGSVTIYAAKTPHDQTNRSAGQDCCTQLRLAPEVAGCIPRAVHVSRLNDPYLHRELRELAGATMPLSKMHRASLHHRGHAALLRLLAIAQENEREQSANAAFQYAEKAFEYVATEFQRIGNLDEVAEHVGVSQDYLRHIFRERYNTSLKGHLTQSRIERAKNLLVYSTLPAKSIAKLCGFTTARHFSTTFNSHTGCPPITYRRTHQQE